MSGLQLCCIHAYEPPNQLCLSFIRLCVLQKGACESKHSMPSRIVSIVSFTHDSSLLARSCLTSDPCSYCQNGTKTSDPFRNDTTLRPYACTPGTFCFAGTGSNEVQEDVIGFAQPCAAGFFCEAASTSAKGSGACPPGFECPKGTANPRPTPKGHYAQHPGTIESTACLPGFYAPTIQTDQCKCCRVPL